MLHPCGILPTFEVVLALVRVSCAVPSASELQDDQEAKAWVEKGVIWAPGAGFNL